MTKRGYFEGSRVGLMEKTQKIGYLALDERDFESIIYECSYLRVMLLRLKMRSLLGPFFVLTFRSTNSKR